jgi:hypothetical protein
MSESKSSEGGSQVRPTLIALIILVTGPDVTQSVLPRFWSPRIDADGGVAAIASVGGANEVLHVG